MADSKDSKKRKYTLFKADDGRPDHLKPCAFFASAEGCKNGAKCRFLHGDAPAEIPQPVVAKVATKIAAPVLMAPESASKETKKRKKNDEDEVPVSAKKQSVKMEQPQETDEIRMLKEQVNLQRQMFEQQLEMLSKRLLEQQAPPAQAKKPIAAPTSAAKKTPVKAAVAIRATMDVDSEESSSESSDSESESDEEDGSDDGKFLFDAVNHVLERGVNQTTPIQPKKAVEAPKPMASAAKAKPIPTPGKTQPVQPPMQQVSRASTSASSDDDDDSDIFLNPQNKSNKATVPIVNPSKKKDIFATKANAIAASSSAAAAAAKESFVPEQVNFATLRYADLVALTQAHRRYDNDYNFSPDYTWVSTKQGGKGTAKVVAMDCEMCETTDPVTNEKEANSLVRFSVIDALEPSRVLIDQLVCPTNPISDARTRIHGISEEQLNSVKFNLRHAQAALLKLINEDTIIIGHSLHHDLKAMHIIHENVVDTAYLFSTVDPNAPNGDTIPSLRMLTDQVLQLKTPVKLHDSVEDSRISCYSAAYYLLHGGQFPTMHRGKSSDRGAGARSVQDETTLLVHHIPSFCAEEHIERMFLSFTSVAPIKVNPISRTVDAADESQGKTLVTFLSAKHAELAFETLQGAIKPDKQNRPQKRVFLKNGSYVNVRK